ncbi:MAG: alcohol dehydrogenase catalytic domain-containing protein [Acidobacteria bacterium]|nr:alcohol dehydrogenase catalytic domain-containing protein [Acidobacteriota bacterium]
MRTVHLESGCVSVREAPLPVREPGYALIRLLCAGICNTDIELKRGYYGFAGTPGHEFVGEVVESDKRSLVGKRVVGEINLACGACEWCRRGLGRHCPNRTVLGIVRHPGAFAEYLTLPDSNLHGVPDGMTTERAVFTEPVAAACEILDQVSFPAGAEVAVLGDGKLGLLIAQVLGASGLAVTLSGRHPEKLRIAARAGIRTVPAEGGLPVAAFDRVVEATGTREGLRQAVEITRPRGTVIMKSTLHGSVEIDTAAVIVNEITLLGSRCGRFEPALEILPKLDVEGMITARYKISEADAAFQKAMKKGALKVLLYP